MNVDIYTDGTYMLHGNKAAAWGAVMLLPEDRRATNPIAEFSGALPPGSTSGTAELVAIVKAVEGLGAGVHARILSDCQTVVKVAGRLKDCALGKGLPKTNRELWRRLQNVVHERSITFEWVRGHSGNPGNHRAHWLAVSHAKLH